MKTSAPYRSRRPSAVALPCVASDGRGVWSTGTGASPQTVEDLDAIAADLAEAERLRARAATRLAAIRARGDGELAVGMTVEAHLRHTTRLGRVGVTTLSVIGDVLEHLPSIRTALAAGSITVEQAAAIARHAARVGPAVRHALDDELTDQPEWQRWEPEHLAAETGRLIAMLTPRLAIEAESRAAEREHLHLQPTLDGQAIVFKGRYEGLNAALFDAVLTAAAPAPTRGIRRAGQAAAGLARVLRDWATGTRSTHDDAETDVDLAPPVTIHLLVDEHTAAKGAAAELWTSLPGLAPTITAPTLDKLRRGEHARTITVRTRNRVPVSVDGRRGHAIDDPDNLSWDTLRELVRTRDGNRCRAPGCDRPLEDAHHIMHRVRGGRDRLSNLAGLCKSCHHRVIHRHGWTGHIDHDGRLHLRRAGHTLTTGARKHHRLRRPPPVPDHLANQPAPTGHDPFGDPLPF